MGGNGIEWEEDWKIGRRGEGIGLNNEWVLGWDGGRLDGREED